MMQAERVKNRILASIYFGLAGALVALNVFRRAGPEDFGALALMVFSVLAVPMWLIAGGLALWGRLWVAICITMPVCLWFWGFSDLFEPIPFWLLILIYMLPSILTIITLATLPWIPWSTRFSLRTLLIVTTLVAVILGLATWLARR